MATMCVYNFYKSCVFLVALSLFSLPLRAQEGSPERPVRLVVVPFHDQTGTNSYQYLSESISDAIIKYLSRIYNYERFKSRGIKTTFSGTTPAAFSEQFKTDIIVYGNYDLTEQTGQASNVSKMSINAVVYVAPFDTSLTLEPVVTRVSSDLFTVIERVSKNIGVYVQEIFNIDTDELQKAGRKKIDLTIKTIDKKAVSDLKKAAEKRKFVDGPATSSYSTLDLRLGLNYGWLLGGNQKRELFENNNVSFNGAGFDVGISGWLYMVSGLYAGLDISYHLLDVNGSINASGDKIDIYNYQSIQGGLILRLGIAEGILPDLNPALFIGGGVDHTWLEFSDEFIALKPQFNTDSASGLGYYMEGGLIIYYKFFHLRGSLKFTRQNPKIEDAEDVLSGNLLNFTFLVGFQF